MENKIKISIFYTFLLLFLTPKPYGFCQEIAYSKTNDNATKNIVSDFYSYHISDIYNPTDYQGQITFSTPKFLTANTVSIIKIQFQQPYKKNRDKNGLRIFVRYDSVEKPMLLAHFNQSTNGIVEELLYIPDLGTQFEVIYDYPDNKSSFQLISFDIIEYKNASAYAVENTLYIDPENSLSGTMITLKIYEHQIFGMSGLYHAYLQSLNYGAAVVCPPNSYIENEPDCYTNYFDVFNIGCNNIDSICAPIFSNLTLCNGYVCGKSGTYKINTVDYRDMDWYKLPLIGAQTVTLKVVAEFKVKIYAISIISGCFVNIPSTPVTANAGDTAFLTYTTNPATSELAILITTSSVTGVVCGSDYVMIYKTVSNLNVPPNPVVTSNPNCGSTYLNTMTPPPNYTYFWQGTTCGVSTTNSTTAIYPIISSGTYNVRGMYNPYGCWTSCSSIPVTTNVPPTIGISATSSQICLGNQTTLTATGANSYSWQPGNLSGNQIHVSPTTTTTYTLTGTVAGCTGSNTISIVVNQNPIVSGSAFPAIICAGESASLTAGSSISGTTYIWMPGNLGGSNISVNPTNTSTYTVTGTVASCSDTATVLIKVEPNPIVSPSTSPAPICNGNLSTLSASSSITGTSFNWMPGNLIGSSVTVYPSTTTIYTITGTAAGCTGSATVSLVVKPTPFLTPSALPSSICTGLTSLLSVSSNVGGTTFSWTPGNLGGSPVSVSPSSTTTYSVTGTVSGCSSLATVSVIVNPNPTVIASASPVAICSGASSSISANSNLAGTTFSWVPGNLSGGNVSVSPGSTTIYSVTGTASGCSGSATVNVSVNPNPTITPTATAAAICEGAASNLSVSSSVVGTTFNWMPGNFSGSPISVSPASTTTYTVSGIAAGCEGSATVSVSVNPNPLITPLAIPSVVCNGESSVLSASSNLSGTTFNWVPGNFSGSNVSVSPGSTTIYSVTGTASGCSGSATMSLSVNPNPTITPTASPAVICEGASSSVSASSSVVGTTFNWMPGNQSGSSISVNPSSTTIYSVTGTIDGCTGSNIVSVAVNPNPTITSTATMDTICEGASSNLSASSSVVGTTFNWMPGNFSGSPISVSPASTTTYTVSGIAAGCEGSATVSVSVNPNPLITPLAIPSAVCNGESSVLSASSNLSGTTFNWVPGNLSGSNVSVSPGSTTIYSVTGTASGCSGSATMSLSVNPNPTITPTASPAVICEGASSSVSASSSVVGTTFNWMPGNQSGSSISVNPSSTTIYSVTGTIDGCTGSNIVSVAVNPNPTITSTATMDTICEGAASNLSASSSVVGTTFNWMPGNFSGSPVSVSPASTTTYTVSGIAAGCGGSATVSVSVNPNPLITPLAIPSVVCNGESSVLSASSNLSGTTFNWVPGNLIGSNVSVSPATTTTYTVTGTDADCSASATVHVLVEYLPVTAGNINGLNEICNGTQTLIYAVSPITDATSYLWNYSGTGANITGTNNTVSITFSNQTTSGTLTVAGQNNCGNGGISPQFNIQVKPLPIFSANASPAMICLGASTTVTAIGNADSYLWTPGNLSGSSVTVSPSNTTTYTATGTLNGCNDTATTHVFVDPCTGIEISEKPDLTLHYENELLTISFAKSVFGKLAIHESSGKKIMNLDLNGEKTLQINTHKMATALYFISLYSENSLTSVTFSKP